MGIVFSFLEFFDLCYHQQALHGPMIALGSLEINEPESEIEAFAAKNVYWKRDREKGVRSLFRDRYGVMDYCDSDLNDRADLKIDLNQPLVPELVGSAMAILNGGTVEHIFDIAQAMINIHDMARLGATIIHLAPISWYEHGYYNFNPRLFTAVAQTNAYVLVAEAFWFPSDVLAAVKCQSVPPQSAPSSFAPRFLAWIRGNAPDPVPLQQAQAIGVAHPTLFITFDGQQYTPQQKVISKLLAVDLIPTNALYMVAYRKTGLREFVFPYDIQS